MCTKWDQVVELQQFKARPWLGRLCATTPWRYTNTWLLSFFGFQHFSISSSFSPCALSASWPSSTSSGFCTRTRQRPPQSSGMFGKKKGLVVSFFNDPLRATDLLQKVSVHRLLPVSRRPWRAPEPVRVWHATQWGQGPLSGQLDVDEAARVGSRPVCSEWNPRILHLVLWQVQRLLLSQLGGTVCNLKLLYNPIMVSYLLRTSDQRSSLMPFSTTPSSCTYYLIRQTCLCYRLWPRLFHPWPWISPETLSLKSDCRISPCWTRTSDRVRILDPIWYFHAHCKKAIQRDYRVTLQVFGHCAANRIREEIKKLAAPCLPLPVHSIAPELEYKECNNATLKRMALSKALDVVANLYNPMSIQDRCPFPCLSRTFEIQAFNLQGIQGRRSKRWSI